MSVSEAEVAILIHAKNQAEAALNQVRQQLKDASGAMGTAEASAKKAGTALHALGSAATAPRAAIGGLIDTLGKIGLAGMGLQALTGAVSGVTTGLIGGNAEMEKYGIQLTTLLGGSAEKARDRLAELAKFGAETPFELPELVRAEKVLLGFGLTGEKVVQMTGQNASQFRTLVGDIAAATGQRFEDIALYMGKFSAGATGEAISRFQELGVVTREQLSDMGIQFSKAGELLSPLPIAMAAITKVTSERFGGGMKSLSDSFEGRMSTLADNINQAKIKIMDSLFTTAKGVVAGLNEMLSSEAFGKALEKVAAFLGGALTTALNIAKGAFETLKPVMSLVSDVFNTLTFRVTEGSESWRDWFERFKALPGPIRAVVGTLRDIGFVIEDLVSGKFDMLQDDLLEMFGIDIAPFVAAFGTARDVIWDVGSVVSGLIGTALGIEDAFDGLFGLVEDWGPIGNLIIDIAAAIDGIVPKAIELAGVFGSNLAKAIQDLAPTGERLGRLFGTIRDVVVGLIPSPLLDLVRGLGDMATTATDGFSPLDALVGIINGLSGAIESATTFVRDHKGVQTALVAVITPLVVLWAAMKIAALAHAVALGISTVATSGLAVAIRLLNLAMAANPIALVALALVGLVAGFIYAYNTSEEFRAVVDTLAHVLKGAVATAVQFVVDRFEEFMRTLQSVGAWVNRAAADIGGFANDIAGAFNDAVAAITGAWESVKAKASEIWNGIGTTLSGVWNGIKNTASAAWNGIKSTLSGIWDGIKGLASTAWDGIKGTISGIQDGIRNKVLAIWNAIPEDIRQDLKKIADNLAGRFNDFIASINTWLNTIKMDITNAWDAITGAVNDALVWVRDSVITPILTAIGGIISGIWTGITTATTAAWDTITGAINSALVWVRDSVVTPIVAAVSGLVTGAWNTISTETTRLWDIITGAVNSALLWLRDEVVTPILNGAGGIVAAIAGAWESVKTTTAQLWSTATGGIAGIVNGAVETVKTAVSGMATSITTTLGGLLTSAGATASNIGQAIIAGIKGAIDAGVQAVKDAILAVVRGALAAVKTLLGISSPSSIFAEIGQNIVDGLINGMWALKDKLLEKVRSLIDLIPEAVRDLLGIESPSKEFELIGKSIVDGMVLGLSSNAGAVVDAMNRLTTPLLEGTTAAISRTVGAFREIVGRGGGLPWNMSVISQAARGQETFDALKRALPGFGQDVFTAGILSLISAANAQFQELADKADVVDRIKSLVLGFEELGQAVPNSLVDAIGKVANELGGPFKDALRDLLGAAPARAAMRQVQAFLGEMSLGQDLADAFRRLATVDLQLPPALLTALQNTQRTSGGYLDNVIKSILHESGVPGFAQGGLIGGPGPIGTPVLIKAHVGERVLPTSQSAGNTFVYSPTIYTPVAPNVLTEFSILRSLAGA